MTDGNASPVGEIDVTLVAGRRPHLLSQTLASFSDRLFRHFAVRRFIANIDPIWGVAADADRCEAAIRSHFPDADVTRPATPGFGRAVKSVWGRTSDLPVLHLEDDWIALHDITPGHVFPVLTPDVGQVALAQGPRRPSDADVVMRTEKTKLFGATLRRKAVNGYGTSPRFLAAGLARRYSDLLDPSLDPEKQILHGLNRRFSHVQKQLKCRMIWRDGSEPFICDTGRDWRAASGVAKTYKDGVVRWETAHE